MEQCFPQENSLYDFIYLDKVRINTLLSQLSNDGVISELKKSMIDSESDNSSLGINLPLSAKKESVNKFEQGLEKSFDTSWVLPMVLLNEMANEIKRNPEVVNQGELILIFGDILLMDIPTLKKNSPLIKHMIRQNTPKNKISNDTNLGFKLIEILPDSIQLRTKDSYGNKYWMTLEPESFTINAENLSLKYGSLLSGDWYILGYVDIKPITDESIHLEKFKNYFSEDSESTRIHQSLMDVFVSNMNSLKTIAGCNYEEYAISPIMIFKPVCK